MARRFGWVLGAWAALACAFVAPVAAADAPMNADAFSERFGIEVTPYFWAAGLKGTFSLGHDIPPLHFDEPFTTILQELKMTFMAAAAVRSGRFALNADVFYVDTALPFHFDEILDFKGDLNSQLSFATLTGSYRLIEGAGGHVDVFAGARFWWLGNALTLDVVTPPLDIDIRVDQSWVDPVVGIGGRVNVTDRLYLTGYADIGGYVRPDDRTWQLAAGAGYTIKDHLDISAGYRIVHTERSDGPLQQTLDVAGPVMGATIRF